jgi:hypothetical protein
VIKEAELPLLLTTRKEAPLLWIGPPNEPRSSRKLPRGAVRGVLNVESEAALRHVASCLGRLVAELHLRGLLAESPATVQGEEPNQEAA